MRFVYVNGDDSDVSGDVIVVRTSLVEHWKHNN